MTSSGVEDAAAISKKKIKKKRLMFAHPLHPHGITPLRVKVRFILKLHSRASWILNLLAEYASQSLMTASNPESFHPT